MHSWTTAVVMLLAMFCAVQAKEQCTDHVDQILHFVLNYDINTMIRATSKFKLKKDQFVQDTTKREPGKHVSLHVKCCCDTAPGSSEINGIPTSLCATKCGHGAAKWDQETAQAKDSKGQTKNIIFAFYDEGENNADSPVFLEIGKRRLGKWGNEEGGHGGYGGWGGHGGNGGWRGHHHHNTQNTLEMFDSGHGRGGGGGGGGHRFKVNLVSGIKKFHNEFEVDENGGENPLSIAKRRRRLLQNSNRSS